MKSALLKSHQPKSSTPAQYQGIYIPSVTPDGTKQCTPLRIILQHTSSPFCFAKLFPNFKMAASSSSNQGYVRLLMELVNAIDNLVTGTATLGAFGK
jgi:hypothetical protein